MAQLPDTPGTVNEDHKKRHAQDICRSAPVRFRAGLPPHLALSPWLQGPRGFLGGSDSIKNLPAMQKTRVQSLSQEDPLEKKMATHSSILAWRMPWM